MSEDQLLILAIAVPLILLLGTMIIGRAVESAHFRRIEQREASLAGIMVSDLRNLPANWRVSEAFLVVGEVVIATDYYKVFIAGIRNLFGGRVRTYETLVERARREAIVRMLEEGRAGGANAIWNVRIETATITGKQQGKSGGVEVIAYGTAMKVTAA